MSYDIIITSATFDCVSVGFLKTDVARITKLDIYMFHDVSWKSINFGVEKSKVKVISHNNSAGVGLCTLVSAVFL